MWGGRYRIKPAAQIAKTAGQPDRCEFVIGNGLAPPADNVWHARQRTEVMHWQLSMKLFYTGPVINTEMLVVMLEKHGINAMQEVLAGESTDEEDLNRTAHVFVTEADFDRAHQLFYAEREDEL
jgi:hypothetical protein